MEKERPQFYANELTPIELSESSLRGVLEDLEVAITEAVGHVRTECPAPGANEDYGTIFSGQLGIAYSLLRVQYQIKDQPNLDTKSLGSLEVKSLIVEAKTRTDLQARSSNIDVNPGRPSPITSAVLGALVTRVLSGQWLEQDSKNLLAVMELAISQPPTFLFRERPMGVDEVLYGRAGLLWAVLEIWKRCPDQVTQTAFAPVLQNIHKLVAAILDAGRAGAKAYQQRAEKGNLVDMPLMWFWFDEYYALGAMHGTTGILSILLDPALPRHSISLSESYIDIAPTITALCKLCVENDGNLPMSVPSRATTRSALLVQICHGAPGMLALLAAAKRNTNFASQFWVVEWDHALSSISDVIWSQGLLSKGCSLCHGLAGNALSLLLLVDPLDDKTDGHLAAALAMVLEAKSTPPFASDSKKYRSPDHPWSLFEGLAGLLCAWSEAYVLVKLRLRVLKLKDKRMLDSAMVARDEEVVGLQQRLLGFPCLVGGGPEVLQSSFI